MTEDEAWTKWCPFAKAMTNGIDNTLSNNGSLNFSCIGSGCMAWRWEKEVTNQDQLDRERNTLISYGTPAKAVYENTEHGYCGLASKP